jgi:hypothetical protein
MSVKYCVSTPIDAVLLAISIGPLDQYLDLYYHHIQRSFWRWVDAYLTRRYGHNSCNYIACVGNANEQSK